MIKHVIKRILGAVGYSVQKIQKGNDHFPEVFQILGFDIDKTKYDFLQRGIVFLKELKTKKQARFIKKENDIIIEIDGLQFEIHTWEELFILAEVFLEGVYNLDLSYKYSLIDIGMNVGITSLFFSKKDNCEKIFSYEPFRETYEMGLKNFSLNKCSEKIQPFNVGLGYPARVVDVIYTSEYKGGIGIKEALVDENDKGDKVVTKLRIEDVSEWIEKNFREYPGPFVAKIDCEGAEYEIIERLKTTGLLRKINVLMIEWHKQGPDKLKEFLRSNEFVILSFNDNNTDIGTLYAVKASGV